MGGRNRREEQREEGVRGLEGREEKEGVVEKKKGKFKGLHHQPICLDFLIAFAILFCILGQIPATEYINILYRKCGICSSD